jgi:hypothetical protein
VLSSQIGMCFWEHALSLPQAVPAMRFRLFCLSLVVRSHHFEVLLGKAAAAAADLHFT